MIVCVCVLIWWMFLCWFDSSQIFFFQTCEVWDWHSCWSCFRAWMKTLKPTRWMCFTDPIITCSYQPVPWIWPGTAAAFIGAGIFGQHMTSLGPKAPYFLSNALLVEFLGQTATWECMIYTNKQVVVLKLFCSITWGIDTTRWWFQMFLEFAPLFGEDEPILTNIFQRGWNHQLATVWENDSETSALLLYSW